MLKLLNKTSVSTALAAAIALGASQAFATLTFDMSITGINGVSTGVGGVTSATALAGTTVNLTLYYTISGAGDTAANSGLYIGGGSFTSSGTGGPAAGYVSAPVLGSNFTAAGSQTGTVGNASNTVWGDITSQYDSAAYVYGRSNAGGTTGVPSPVLGLGSVTMPLATINYVVGASDPSSFVLSFTPRDRSGVADQLWQENGVAVDDTISALGVTQGVTINNGTVAGPSTWIATTSGSTWDASGNWSGGTPNSATAAAVFGTGGATPSTTAVSNAVNHTVNSITFNGNGNNDAGKGAGNYSISGAGTITLAGTSASISATGGTQYISTTLAAAPGTQVNIKGAGTIVIGSTSGGKINLAAATGLTIGTGSDTPTLQLAQMTGGPASNPASEFPGGIGPRNTAATVVEMNGLTINTGAVLDITNHDLVIHNASASAEAATFAKVEQYLANACDFNSWDMVGNTSLPLLTSSTAENDPLARTTIAVATGDEFQNNNENGVTFDGLTVASTDVLVKFTYIGDMTLDGLVGPDDIGQYLSDKASPVPGYDYSNGDLDYIGGIGPDATGAMISAYNAFKPYSGLGIGLNGNEAQIPEPASLGMLGLGALGLLARRRR